MIAPVMQTQTATPLILKIPSYAHNAIVYSPFAPDRLAVASGTNFGLSGKGALHVLRKVVGGRGKQLGLERSFETPDCVFDVSWSESHPDHVLLACGDGSCLLFNLAAPANHVRPQAVWKEHSKEVFGVDWSNLDKQKFASCSWDGSTKIWDQSSSTSIRTLTSSQDPSSECIYTSLWSPHQPQLIGSVTSKGRFVLHDLRSSTIALDLVTHQPETLSFDWNKYQADLIATGGVDTAVRVWDLRQTRQSGGSSAPKGPQQEFRGHTFAVKRVQWSPFERNVLASTSYDMTCRVWTMDPSRARDPALSTYTGHREFVHGVAWSLQDPGELATASWDQTVHLVRP